MKRFWDEADIRAQTDKQLMLTIATLNPNGHFARQVRWSMKELDRRGVDYSIYLEPISAKRSC